MSEFALSADKFINIYLIPMAWKVTGAIVLWIVGGWIIGWISRMSANGMAARKVDPTLIRYADAAIRVVLRIVLVIAILAVFGIETTSFAALLAAAGVAIGAAWAGLLSNFAAGAFLIILRPFKVGDMISGGGVTGDVKEIGLFATAIDTVDNLRIYVGNAKILGDNIVNYTQNDFRRVDLKAQIAHTVDPKDAIAKLAERVSQIQNVVKTPPPQVEILEFNPAGALLGVRPFCHNSNYWQVYFDTNRAIQEVCASAGYPVPAPHTVMLQRQAG